MKTLKKIIEEHKLGVLEECNLSINPNYGTDKENPKSYINEFYEENFKKYKDKDISLLEIGVRSGPSLKLWSEYFSKESKIYGLDNLYDKDINLVPVNNDWISSSNVEYIIGDAYDEKVSNRFGKIDILIDDGPHTFESHVKLLNLYLNKINSGGIIVIEDVSYNPNNLYEYLPNNLKDTSYICDYGGYDDRLIVIEGF